MRLNDKQLLEIVELLKLTIIEHKENILKMPNAHMTLNDNLMNVLIDYFLEHTLELKEILQYIDFSNATLVNKKVSFVDFSYYLNISLDPQLVYDKNLMGSKLFGIDFSNKRFDDVKCVATSFVGARNVDLNPQTVANKNLVHSKLSGVDLRGKDLTDVMLEDADFTDAIISKDIKLNLKNNYRGLKGLDKAIVLEDIENITDDNYDKCKKYIINMFKK